MKNVAVMVLGFALTGAVLMGCDESRQSRQDIQPDMNASISEEAETDSIAEKSEPDEAEKIAQTSEEYEDNFAVDSKAAKEFAQKVKDAAASKDLDALAELTEFPVYVGLPDVGAVETKEEFLNLGAEAVFTDELLESIEMADIENFQPSMAGFPISDGKNKANIIFGVVDGVLAISGINY